MPDRWHELRGDLCVEEVRRKAGMNRPGIPQRFTNGRAVFWLAALSLGL